MQDIMDHKGKFRMDLLMTHEFQAEVRVAWLRSGSYIEAPAAVLLDINNTVTEMNDQ